MQLIKNTILFFIFAVINTGLGQEGGISIFDIQYTTASDGQSPKNGQVVSCLGGIVTHKVLMGRPRIILQDPIIRDPAIQGSHSCWGAIQVKDWFYTTFNNVTIGDWIELNNVTVEDNRGTTFLQYWNSNPDGSMPSYTVISRNNPVPEPLVIDVNTITNPLENPGEPGCYYVENHDAEKYESMWIKIKKVFVVEKDLGKATDNYVLQSSEKPNDPNFSCWASDYMNVDAVGDYHPYVQVNRHLCSIEGILEQYTYLSNGWDYYQLLTTKTEDFLLNQPGDLDDDCDVDFTDFSGLAAYWLVSCAADPNVCGGADLTNDRFVDEHDLAELTLYWLEGK
jgi:hypothetical protein